MKLRAVGYWLGNTISSVAIVFANKLLMGKHKFTFPTCLSGLHLIVSGALLAVSDVSPTRKPSPTLPLSELLLFVLIGNLSLVGMNLSLLINTVSFYQVSKLSIMPCVSLIEYIAYGNKLTLAQFFSMILVLFGAACVTIVDFDIDLTLKGCVVAFIAIITTGTQQLLVRHLQVKHGFAPAEFMLATAPPQAAMLLVFGPFLDKAAFGSWIVDFDWNIMAAFLVALTCALALLVNLSQTACLGSFSALSFQVLGHTKTILILIGSWVFLNEIMTQLKIYGICMAISGMAAYTFLKMKG